jgi:hypothetical protein
VPPAASFMRRWRVCLDEYLAYDYEGYLATESA